MKVAILVLLAFLIGAKAGYFVRGKEFRHVHNNGVFVDISDSGPFPLEAFVRLNREMDGILEQVAGKDASMDHVVSVVPDGGASYQVVIPECDDSHTFTKGQRTKLFEEIDTRMMKYAFLYESK